MLYRSIILPIDVAHLDTAAPMIEKAKVLLEPGGRLTAVYVVPDVPSYVIAEMPEDFLPITMRKSEKALHSLFTDAGLEADVRILTGQTARAILSAAEQAKADLIMVSSHRPGLSDYLLGSTAARVVRHAETSVLVIR